MRRIFFLAIAAGLILGLIAVFLWNELIQELILVPMTYVVWLGGLLYRSFDQKIWWSTLLILVLILALTSLRLKPRVQWQKPRFKKEIPHRVELWRKRLEEADRGTYMKWRLAQHLSRLFVEAISYRSGLTPKQIEQHIQKRTIDLPEEMSAYLQAARGFGAASSMSHRWNSARIPHPLEISPELILEFLEDYLGLEQ